MEREFPTADVAVTVLLVVADVERAKRFYRDVLGASLYREYGGTSVVLSFQGTWLLLVTGGGPTDDKPNVSFAPPADPNRVSHELTLRVPDWPRRVRGPAGPRRPVPHASHDPGQRDQSLFPRPRWASARNQLDRDVSETPGAAGGGETTRPAPVSLTAIS